jgi:hypothetical protein
VSAKYHWPVESNFSRDHPAKKEMRIVFGCRSECKDAKEDSMSKRALQLLLLCLWLATGTLWAANNPFVGKWKLNPSRSDLSDQMKVEAASANKYTFDFGVGYVETVVADGTDQPGSFGTTMSVTVEGPDTWKVVRKKDGRMLITAIWKLSKDGKTLSDDFTGYRPNGSNFNLYDVYKRTAGRSGFPGTWESTSEKMNSVYEIQIQPYDGDGLSFITPAEHETQYMKFDGEEYPDVGPDVLPGSVSSGRRVNERIVEMTDKIKGKVRNTRRSSFLPMSRPGR